MKNDFTDGSVDLAATRALADGESVRAGATVSAAGVEHESRLRQSVARAMQGVPSGEAGLGERIEQALDHDEALRNRVKTLLHQSVARDIAPPQRHARGVQRWMPWSAVAALLFGVVSTVMWLSNRGTDPVFPLSAELSSRLQTTYATAERAAGPASMSMDAALDEAAQIFGQRPMGIDLAGQRAELLWARSTRTATGGSGYEFGFGVYPADSASRAERREVTLVVAPDDDYSRGAMNDARLYRILGSDLMVRGWRYGGLTYFMTAESKRALFCLQGAMRIPETIEASCDWPDNK